MCQVLLEGVQKVGWEAGPLVSVLGVGVWMLAGCVQPVLCSRVSHRSLMRHGRTEAFHIPTTLPPHAARHELLELLGR